MENMKKICIIDGDENILYRYSVTGSDNVRVIHIERYEEYDEEYDEEIDEEFDEEYDEEYDDDYDDVYYSDYDDGCLGSHDIMIGKADWYCIAFPDMGTASPALKSVSDFGCVADQVHDAGYRGTDVDAIALAITNIAEEGF